MGANFSAVCLLMARDLARDHPGPIGLVESDWGSTPIEGWLPYAGLAAAGVDEAILAMLDAYRRDPALARQTYDDQVEKDWNRPAKVAFASLFNGMIAPLAGSRFAGAVWYQGENNAARATSRAQYVAFLQALAASWRERFAADLPVVIVQIAPFGKPSSQPGPSASAEIREAQREFARDDAHAALVTTIDVGERLDIHPPLKLPVAQRAANAFRHLIYGAPASVMGPRPQTAFAEDGAVHVRITDAQGALQAVSWGQPGPLQLCDASRSCAFADGRIEGDTWS